MEFLTEWFWFFLFLPLAALTGWVIGRRGGQRHGESQVSRLSSTYFRGLNYLLSEQPDKAIELFLHIAELDKETFETQVALGHLFRRRGEVDRAIRLHQGLVQRHDLSDAQRVQALLALGEDYMKSGLLDRAETVFTDLAKIDQRAPQALKHLISIYQAERDWEKAIDNAARYEEVTGEPMGKLISQFEAQAGFNVIIMSPVAAGVGLTVVSANHVIHLERHWNPAKEAQASDRVYRIGQQKPVFIHLPTLTHPRFDAFDVHLDRLLRGKLMLKDAVVTPEAVSEREMTSAMGL